jgi:hypothetical protein
VFGAPQWTKPNNGRWLEIKTHRRWEYMTNTFWPQCILLYTHTHRHKRVKYWLQSHAGVVCAVW